MDQEEPIKDYIDDKEGTKETDNNPDNLQEKIKVEQPLDELDEDENEFNNSNVTINNVTKEINNFRNETSLEIFTQETVINANVQEYASYETFDEYVPEYFYENSDEHATKYNYCNDETKEINMTGNEPILKRFTQESGINQNVQYYGSYDATNIITESNSMNLNHYSNADIEDKRDEKDNEYNLPTSNGSSNSHSSNRNSNNSNNKSNSSKINSSKDSDDNDSSDDSYSDDTFANKENHGIDKTNMDTEIATDSEGHDEENEEKLLTKTGNKVFEHPLQNEARKQNVSEECIDLFSDTDVNMNRDSENSFNNDADTNKTEANNKSNGFS